MQKTILSIFIIAISLTSKSQNIIYGGRVIDQDSIAIPFASVELTNVKGTSYNKISGEDGQFELLVDSTGIYKIKITHSSYKVYSNTIEILNNLNKAICVLSKNDETLGTVTVKATKKQLITRKIDRVIMEVENNPLAAGRSSMDIFKLAPGVFVNNGSISINGVSGAKVMVNGRLLSLGGADLQNYLEGLKSSDIKSIEIIPHPPAEYDAEGGGGLINIVMKKNTQSGINGRIGADYSIGIGKFPSYNPSFGIDYKKGKFSIGGSYNYADEKSFQQLNQSRDFSGNGKYSAENHEISKRKSSNVRANVGFDITERQYIGVFYNGQFTRRMDSTSSFNNVEYPDAQNNFYSKGKFPSSSNTKYSNIGLNYSIQPDTAGSKIDINADYTYNNREGISSTMSKMFGFDDQLISDTSFNFYYPSIAKIFTVDAKFEKHFNEKLIITLGSKGSFTEIENNNQYEVLNNGQWNKNVVPGFEYLYKENILAAFFNISGTAKLFEYKIGLRGENSSITGLLNEKDAKQNFSRDYFNLFPAVFIKQNLNENGKNYLSLSYNRRIVRPSYFELNPYKYFIDNFTVQTGNPLLNPQFTDAFELGSLWKGKYYISFGYNFTKDIISQVLEIDATEDLTTAIRKNTGEKKVYSVTINAPVKITKWWNSNSNLLLTYTENKAPEFDLSQPSFIFQTQNDFTISPTTTASLSGFYTPKVLTGNIISGRIAEVNIALQKSFLNRKLISTINLSDIFYTNNFKATSYYNDAKMHIAQNEQTRVLTLSLTYNFNAGKAFKNRSKQNSNADENSRLK